MDSKIAYPFTTDRVGHFVACAVHVYKHVHVYTHMRLYEFILHVASAGLQTYT